MPLTIRSRFLALLVVALLVFGIESLIVTDAEEIEALGERAAKAVRERDWTGLESVLHEDFLYGARNREETVAHVRGLVEKYKPIGIDIVFIDIRVEGDEASASGVVSGTALGRPARVPVEARLRRTEAGWKLWKVTGGSYVR